MAWNKIKSGAIAVAITLVLAGSALMVLQELKRAYAGPLVVASFEPMTGEWEGTFEMRGDGLPNPVPQAVALSIRMTQQGRGCEIEMRVSDPTGRSTAVYHFSHTLNKAGDRIITVDDPRVARVDGEGVVTESMDDRNTGEWRAAFRAKHKNQNGFTECRWIRKGDELIIDREDAMTGGQHTSHLYSDLRLRRRN